MEGLVAAFCTAFLGLALALVPLWALARRPGDIAASLSRFGVAFAGACLALFAAALLVPPLYARTALLVVTWAMAVMRVRREKIAGLDAQFAAVLVLVSLISALLPDTRYVLWDNYSHWAVITRSFDLGEPLVGNSYTMFPTYPPLQPLLLFYLQGLLDFTTANLQTHRVALLVYLTLLMLFGAGSKEARAPRLVQLALFPLLVGISFRLNGGFQSGYADSTASILFAVAAVAAYHHANRPNLASLWLCGISLAAVSLTRVGAMPPAMLLGFGFVALDLFLRRADAEWPLRRRLPAYAVAAFGPFMAYALHTAVMAAHYGQLQSPPSDLFLSLRHLLQGANPEFTRAIVHALLFDGLPRVGGYGASPVVLFLAGVVLAALGILFAERRFLPFVFAIGLAGLFALWALAVVLQMDGFFQGSTQLPSFDRYVSVLLFPFLAGALMLVLHPTTANGKRLALLAVVVGAALVQGALPSMRFWRPNVPDTKVAPIASAAREWTGRDHTWIIASPDVDGAENAQLRTLILRYLLMPAHTNDNYCFVLPHCPQESSETFGNFLAASPYRWVLIDRVGRRETQLLAPMVDDPRFLAGRAGRWALFRVVPDSARRGGISLAGVRNPEFARQPMIPPTLGAPQ